MPTKAQLQERDEARDTLRALLPPGTEVRTLLRHVSRSGMMRAIDVYVIHDNNLQRITWSVAKATGEKYSNKYDALEVGGAGMDMGFAVVYGLSRTLYPDGFYCIGEGDDNWRGRCPSNDHSNDYGAFKRGERATERDYSLTRHHKDGGYALTQRWI